MCSLRLCKVVNYFTTWEGLFDVLVVEVYDGVAIWERLTFDAVIEDYFFFTILIDALDFAILSDVLLCHFLIGQRLIMVFLRVLETVIFLFFLHLVRRFLSCIVVRLLNYFTALKV